MCNTNIVLELDSESKKYISSCNLTRKGSGVARVNSYSIKLRAWENEQGVVLYEGISNWKLESGSLIVNTRIL